MSSSASSSSNINNHSNQAMRILSHAPVVPLPFRVDNLFCIGSPLGMFLLGMLQVTCVLQDSSFSTYHLLFLLLLFLPLHHRIIIIICSQNANWFLFWNHKSEMDRARALIFRNVTTSTTFSIQTTLWYGCVFNGMHTRNAYLCMYAKYDRIRFHN